MAALLREIQRNNVYSAALIGVTALGIALRLYYLAQPIRYDEALTFLAYASHPLRDLIATYDQPNNHIFNSILIHFAYRLFGNEVWILRLPAFVAGVLIIPALYGVAAYLYNRTAALLAAALAAVALSLVEYSVLARGYTIITLDAIILIGLAAYLRQNTDWQSWLTFALLGAVGFYTVPVMLYPMGMISLWLLLSILRESAGMRRRLLVWRFVITHGILSALTLIFYLPVIRQEGVSALVGNEFVTRLPAGEFYPQLSRVAEMMVQFPFRGFPEPLIVLLLLGAAAAWLLHRRVSRTRVSLMTAAALWLAPLILFQRVIPFDRNWLFLAPILLMVGAAGLVFLLGILHRNTIIAGALVLALALAALLVDSRALLLSDQVGTVPDAEAAALFLGEIVQPGDEILSPIPVDSPLQYYLEYHELPAVSIRNQYHTSWVDLRHASIDHQFVLIDSAMDTTQFYTLFQLTSPTFDARLTPVRTFNALTLYQFVYPTYPDGILFLSDFDDWRTDGIYFHNLEMTERVTARGRTMIVATGDDWGQLLWTGGHTWQDYALDIELNVLKPSPDLQDIYLNMRYLPHTGDYIAALSVQNDRVELSMDVGETWAGVLAEADIPLQANRWMTFGMRALDETITLTVNGEPVVSAEDAQIIEGTVRVMIPPHTQLELDAIRVTDLTSP